MKKKITVRSSNLKNIAFFELPDQTMYGDMPQVYSTKKED